MFNVIRQINQLVTQANRIAGQAGEGPRWSLFLTNRSFIAQVIATLAGILLLAGIVLPGSPELWAEGIVGIVFVLGQLWAFAERLMGRTRVVWSKRQAHEAVEEADALTEALRDAGAMT
ncbi:MAG: hypothetical protein Q4G36_08145 [Paracoccus sp. (in: a-proteobacteria)]|nr:hypothetical protein [Paracoccus sp. (in: a-proteobacteria)]